MAAMKKSESEMPAWMLQGEEREQAKQKAAEKAAIKQKDLARRQSLAEDAFIEADVNQSGTVDEMEVRCYGACHSDSLD